MGLHQLALRAAAKPSGIGALQPPTQGPDPASPPAVLALGRPVAERNPWVAPQEVQISNFMALPELPGEAAPVDIAAVDELPLGSWIELWANGKWVRTQLTWASPHSTLFLFTSVFGTTQSMTRRSRDKLVASGNLRVVSSQTVVDGALDAVAQMAMRNSIDIMI